MEFLKRILAFKLFSGCRPFILMYHRILSDHNSEVFPVQPGMYVSTVNFEKNIVHLKKNFEIIRLKDMLDLFFDGKNLDKHCAITFDDGWEDNYINAFPILQKYDVPATFFLATGFISTNKWFWFDEVAFFMDKFALSDQVRLFSRTCISNKILKIVSEVDVPLGDRVTKTVYELKTTVSISDRLNLMTDICLMNRRLGECSKVMMDWGQIQKMQSTGLADFYSHSHSHENLDVCGEEFLTIDLGQSLAEMSKNLPGSSPHIFCYPSGRHNNVVEKVLKNLNFTYATTTERGFIDRGNPYQIMRIGVHNDISNKVIQRLG